MATKKCKVGNRYKCQWCEERYKAERETQWFCEPECAARYWLTVPPRMKGRRDLAREIAAGFGFRSLAELFFHVKMEQQGLIDATSYEPDTFEWTPKIRHYTPDWKVVRPNGTIFYLEFKGKLDQEQRSKLLGIKESLPDLDLRIVLEKPKNKISSRSATRYYQWCENNGFPWTSGDIGIPQSWMEEECL